MARNQHNWRARRIVETEVDDSETKKIVLDRKTLTGYDGGSYDQSNPLVLPSQKRATRKKETKATKVERLSRKKRKFLQKIVARKEHKISRQRLYDMMAEVQATPQDMARYVSTSQMQTVGHRRRLTLQRAQTETNDRGRANEATKSIKGSLRKPKMLPEVEEEKEEEEMMVEDKKDECVVAPVLPPPPSPPPPPPEAIPPPKTQEATISQEQRNVVLVERPPGIQAARLRLPILAEEQTVMEAIGDHAIVVLTGETGSGKTTQLPQFLYEAGYTSVGRKVAVTEPRRVAAVTMSRRVAEELGLTSAEVSYQIRYDGNVTPRTRIKFMTDGVLLREMQKDFLLNEYSVVVVDEAHERSVFTDILIGLLSRVVPLRNKRGDPLKLVVMSATLRVDDFVGNARLFRTPPPLVTVEARQFPVDVHFNRVTPLDDYVPEVFHKVCKIHRRMAPGGILVFLTGSQEVNVMCRKLRETFPFPDGCSSAEATEKVTVPGKRHWTVRQGGGAKKKIKQVAAAVQVLPQIDLDDYSVLPPDDDDDDVADDEEEKNLDGAEDQAFRANEEEGKAKKRKQAAQPMFVLPLYALLPPHRQAAVFRTPPDGCRFCVVATNVAETSVTIPNIRYVVDCGKMKTRVYDRVTGVSAFQLTWTSKASANQRAGRAGRLGPGHCFRIYSSAVFNDFATFATPEICRRPIDDVVLQLKEMSIDRVVNFPLPTPLQPESVRAAETRLEMLGALEMTRRENASKITPLGRAMASFPVAPRYGKMLALGHQYDLLPFVVCLVSALTVQEVLIESASSDQEDVEQKQRRSRWMALRKTWAGQGNSLALGDMMVLLKAVGAAEYAGATVQFCEEHGLRHKALVEIRRLRVQLTNAVSEVLPSADLGVDPRMSPPTDVQARLLRQVVMAGLPDRVARKVLESEVHTDDRRKWRKAYKTSDLEDPVFIHPSSVLFRELPEYVVFQEIFETSKMYMRGGVTAIEPQWLPLFFPSLCVFSKPLETPAPRYNAATGTVCCHITATFGRCGWALPVSEVEHPQGLARVRHFARVFLAGDVCPTLQKFVDHLLVPPTTMTKSWAKLQPKTERFLSALLSSKVDSRSSLYQAWQNDDKYLLREYCEWLPESLEADVRSLWPPV